MKKLLFLPILPAFLAACSGLGGPPPQPGTPVATLQARLGAPTGRYPNGSDTMLEYAQGPSGQTTSTQTNAPWSVQQPFLTQGFNTYQNLLNNNPLKYYPGQTYAGETPQQQAAVDMATRTASRGRSPRSRSG